MTEPTIADALAVAIKTAETNAAFFSEKGSQLSVGSIIAFGIPISTRYNHAREMIEMINFCTSIAWAGATRFVESVFYDSKACVCCINTKPGIEHNYEVRDAIEKAALMNITQYDLFGTVGHMNGNNDW